MERNASQDFIEALEKQKQVLKSQFDAVVQELLYADPLNAVRLEGQRDNLNQKIQEIEEKINNKSFDKLFEILLSDCNIILNKVDIAYKKALNKPRSIPPKDFKFIIQELTGRIFDGYDCLHRFVEHLLRLLRSSQVKEEEKYKKQLRIISDLGEWARRYIPDYELLKQRIEEEENNFNNKYPCLLIRIQEATKKKYYISAWFVCDVKSYRESHERSLIENLIINEEMVINNHTYQERFEIKIREIIEQCPSHDYELMIHIFLPQSLMNTDIDQWFLKDKRPNYRLGIRFKMVLRTEKRLDQKYGYPLFKHLRAEWQRRWEDIEDKFTQSAFDILKDGDPKNFEETLSVLENTDKALGVKLAHPLSSIQSEDSLKELFEILIEETAIPIVLWVRQAPDELACSEELKNYLKGSILKKLPDEIKKARVESSAKENLIGNHLSLLWDDPYLLPPDCSQTFINSNPN